MAVLGIVDVWNSFEAGREQRPHRRPTIGASSPWVRSSRHIENRMVAEERHYLVQVVPVEGDRFKNHVSGALTVAERLVTRAS